jgi:hypothetical protein
METQPQDTPQRMSDTKRNSTHFKGVMWAARGMPIVIENFSVTRTIQGYKYLWKQFSTNYEYQQRFQQL